MLCGLGVPALRSLWGAVQNRYLYILRMYCKSCISFNFLILIYNLHGLPQKTITRHYRKKKDSVFFLNNSLNLLQKKIAHIYCKKKKTRLDDFLVHSLPFSPFTTRIDHARKMGLHLEKMIKI